MGRLAQLACLGSLGAALPVYAYTQIADERVRQLLLASALVSLLGFFVTLYLVPRVARKTQSRGICGKDLNKKGTPSGETPIPESAGLAVGCAFLLCIVSAKRGGGIMQGWGHAGGCSTHHNSTFMVCASCRQADDGSRINAVIALYLIP